MSELTDALRQRVFELERRKARLSAAINRLQSEVIQTTKKIDGYLNILELEGSNAQTADGVLSETDMQEKAEASPPKSKMSVIRKHILEIGARGFEPKEIARFVLSAGISSHYAFAYNAVKRMKENGELLEDSGRYYPTGRLVESAERFN